MRQISRFLTARLTALKIEEPGGLASFAVALASVVVATIARWAFDGYLGDRGPFVTYFPAMAFCVWFGGMRTAFIAAVVSLLVAKYLFVEPRYELPFIHFQMDNVPGAFLFCVVSLLIIGFGEAARRSSRRRAERDLQTSRDEFRAIFELAGIGMAQGDPTTGTITRVNDHFVKLTGYSADELLMKHYLDLTHPDDKEKDRLRLADVLAGKRDKWETEKRYIRKDGAIIWVIVNGTLVRDSSGKPLRLNAHIQDVTERVQARETLRFLSNATARLNASMELEDTVRSLADLPIPFLADFCAVEMFAEDGCVEVVAASHKNPEQHKRIQNALDDLPRSACSPILGPFEGDGRQLKILAELKLPRSDEEVAQILKPVSLMTAPIASRDRIIGVLILAVTESNRRYTEKDLELAGELAGRSAVAIENARLYRSIERASQQKDQFLAMLAHELRNPLAAIGYAVRVAEKGSADANEPLAIIDRQVRNLSRLIDDLLDVSRITRNRISLKVDSAPVVELVKRAIASARPLIEERRHDLVCEFPGEDLTAVVDPTRIEQVILNLLLNAAKYTPRGGQIVVSVARDGECAAIRVRDNGLGISREMLPHVFDLFMQVDHSLDRSHGGLGIGLTVVKSLVELHGGTVTAVSEGEGMGSEFCVRLPLAHIQTPAPAETSLAALASRSRSILIADDNIDTANASAMLLRALGHNVRAVYDGRSAIEAAREFRPEVCLLDIGLPQMDGLRLCHALRKEGFHQALMIAVSGYGLDEDRRRSLEAGFDHHLTKPVEFNTLIELIRSTNSSRGGPADPDEEQLAAVENVRE